MTAHVKSAILATFTVFALISCAGRPDMIAQSEKPETSIWAERAISDIRAGHQLMLDNHPGPVDSQNPVFAEVADKALNESLQLAQKVDSPLAYFNALNAYSAYYRDGHFGLMANDKFWESLDENTDDWAGLLIGWRSGTYTVVHAEAFANVTAGSTLVSCDGKLGDTLMDEHVFRFRNQGPEIKSHFALRAFEILRDRGNTLIQRPSECTFTDAGKRYTRTLNWQAWDAGTRNALMDKALFGPRPDTGLQTISTGVVWINLPDFNPQDDAADLNALIANVEANAATYRSAKAIVFDVRGNNGGNSLWGNRLLTALYGEPHFKHRTLNPGVEVHWRAVQGSIDKLESYKLQYAKQGNEDYVAHFDGLINGLKKALDAGHTMYIETNAKQGDAAPRAPNPVSANVYLLTHGWCASACLDFADDILAMENSQHIGYPTASDSTYMDIRFEPLPSGYGQIILPMKVYRGRKRGNGAYYTPDILFDEYNWTDQRLHAWFLKDVLKD